MFSVDSYHRISFSLREFRSSTQKAASERDAEVAKASRSLAVIEGGRLTRADIVALEDSIREVDSGTRELQQETNACMYHSGLHLHGIFA